MTQITIPDVDTEVSYSVTTPQTGPFTVPFPFFDDDDVKGEVTDALGNVTTLVHSTDFVWTTQDAPVGQEGSGYTGGSITLNASIGADGNTTLRLYRDTVIDRTANYPNTGPFSMPLLNDEQNKHIAILQELARRHNELDAAQVVNAAAILVNAAAIAQNATDILTNYNNIQALTAGDIGGAYALLSDLISTDNGKGASLISIEDAGALITATNLEAVLAELASDIATNAANISTNVNAIDTNATNIAFNTAGLANWQFKFRETDNPATNDTDATETQLDLFTVSRGELYIIEAYLSINCAGAGGGGLRASFGGTLTVADRAYTGYAVNESGAVTDDHDNGGVSILFPPGSLGAGDSGVHIRGFVYFSAGTGTGTYGLNWGQHTSSPDTTTVKRGSWVSLRKIS